MQPPVKLNENDSLKELIKKITKIINDIYSKLGKLDRVVDINKEELRS